MMPSADMKTGVRSLFRGDHFFAAWSVDGTVVA